jgi:hypothetical protein
MSAAPTRRFRPDAVHAWLLALAAGILPSCKPAVHPEAPAPMEDVDVLPGRRSARASESPASDAPADIEPEREPPAQRPKSAPPASMRRGTVDRAALDAVLDRGPGVFLGGFELAPHFRDQRFAGWAIVRFLGSGALFDTVDLRPGDVVMKVNGFTIARPRNLQELWLDLRVAEAIVVQAERDGQPFELRFDVIDAPRSSAP